MSTNELIKKYVEKFNQHDDELITQHISNNQALKWMNENVPIFECPEKVMEETYYFRWWVYRKHVKLTPEGFIITEFLPDVYWAGKYNSINCAIGHHLTEGRWLKNGTAYINDYINFWLRGSGDVRSYSTWIANAIYQYCLIKGNFSIAHELLPELIENYYHWEKSHKHHSGLFWSIDDRDAMEYSISGNGLRPTLNSYMYADALAISKIAGQKGDVENEEIFRHKALELKKLVQEKLWDPESDFFKVFPLESKDIVPESWDFANISVHHNVREEIGFIPWCFNLPDPGFETAWRQVKNKRGFYAPYGPTTAEQRHLRFMYEHDHECLWNGPSWPYATSQTLTAMSNVIKDYTQPFLTKQDFYELLLVYTNSHFRINKDGKKVNWLDENLDPYTGEWLSRKILEEGNWRKDKGGYERGKDYNHSTYCDLIINKLFGVEPTEDGKINIRPLIPDNWEYCRLEGVCCHGKELTIIYDKTGSKYQNGKGFKVYYDGICVHESNQIEQACIITKRR